MQAEPLKKLAPFVAVLAVLAIARSAAARERLAVFIAVEREPALSENLAEVTIAKLAESGEFELVGSRELESIARDVPSAHKEGLAACVELPACLGEVGRRAGAKRAVIGKVTRGDAAYDLELSLVQTETFETQRKRQQTTPAELGALIAAVQTAAAELVAPNAPPTDETPGRAPNSPPPAAAGIETATAGAPPLSALDPTSAKSSAPSDVQSAEPPWQMYAGFGAAGLAVVSFSPLAAVMANASHSPPAGDTRAERQADIEHRRNQAKAANVLLRHRRRAFRGGRRVVRVAMTRSTEGHLDPLGMRVVSSEPMSSYRSARSDIVQRGRFR